MVIRPADTARRNVAGALACALALPGRALALMAGDPPDTPIRRLDPNRADSPFASVGSITNGEGHVYSGVLVGARHVLTAAHVLPAEPMTLRFHLNIDGDLSSTLGVRRAFRHPGFKGFTPPYPPNDLALLELDADAPPIVHPPIAPVAPMPGTIIELVGYGASGNGGKGATLPANAALKRHGENVIEHLLRLNPDDVQPALYLFTFHAPESPPRRVALSLGNLRETGLASGDSGSAAYCWLDGRRHLFGINTFVQQRANGAGPVFGFGTVGGGQLLTAHRDWLRSIARI